jgi:hypothetical protein
MSEDEIIHCAEPQAKGSRISIRFSPKLSEDPSVYRVFRKADGRSFYIGETRNVAKRLKFLFRCNPGNNPHPCHTYFKRAYGRYPEVDEFCESFSVAVVNTKKLFGRIELEEQLQGKFGTNRQNFYDRWTNSNDGQGGHRVF